MHQSKRFVVFKRLFTVGILWLPLFLAAQSATWLDYVDAKNSAAEPILPDFSYAGYHYGNDAIPNVNHAVFDVADYGAIPNDGNDDSSAIQAAINAAQANGSGIVLLHAGRYRATGLRVSSSNIVIRGAGALIGGTEIFSEGTPNGGAGVAILFKPSSTGNKSTITQVTGNAGRETFQIQVAGTSNLSVGQLVTLYSRDPDPALLADFFAPFTPSGTETLNQGVEVKERHVIQAINGNTLTFREPIHYNVNANYNWVIQNAGNYLQEVGLEEIAFTGNWNTHRVFVHHRSILDNQGWRGPEFNHVHNGWMKNIRNVNTNGGIYATNSINCSLLGLILEGNDGHHGVLINTSTRTLVGLVYEKNIWEHPASQTGPNVGNVFWRYESREVMDIDNHGKYGYATLRDLVSGHNPGNGSGNSIQNPRHLRYYTLWNYQYKFRGPISSQPAHNFWASAFSSIVQPIVVGYQAPPDMLVLQAQDTASSSSPKPVYAAMQVNESYGSAVTPESLYEAQLEHRLGVLPAWVDQFKQAWALNKNTTAFMDSGLDNAVFSSGSTIALFANVPSEISGHVSQVEFLHGNSVIGSAASSPYYFNWSNVADGTYAIRARVTRTDGEMGISSPVNFSVGTQSTTPLNVAIVQALIDPSIDTQASSHLIDNDLNTYWTSNASKQKPNANRTPQLVDFDLGASTNVNRIDIAWHLGEQRAYYLRVLLSNDNSNWTEVLRTISSASTSGFETYYFDGEPSRYLRLVGFTNSVTRSSEINEIDLYEGPMGGGNIFPIANANGPYVGTVGTPINFSSAGTSDPNGSALSYLWDFGNGLTNSTANPNYSYPAAGSYTVILTVTNEQGLSHSRSTTATITDPGTAPSLQNGVPISGLSASTGADIEYYIEVPNGASNLVIQISGGSGDADLYTRAGLPPTDSVYDCRPYIGGNTESCSEPNPSPGRWFVRVKAYSGFSGVTLTASYTGGGSSSSGGSSSGGSSSGGSSSGGSSSGGSSSGGSSSGGSSSGGSSSGGSSSSSGGSSSGGCGQITGNANGPYTGTVGTPINFSSVGSCSANGGIIEWEWDFGDGGSSTQAYPSYTYNTAGTYEVVLLVIDDVGDEAEVITNATITTAGGSSSGGSSSGGSSGSSGASSSGGSSSGGSSSSSGGSSSGGSSSGGSSGACNQITGSANGPYNGTVGTPINFSSAGSCSPNGGIVEWEWDFADGGSSTQANPSYTYNSGGTYAVVLLVVDDAGDEAEVVTTVSIANAGNGALPNSGSAIADACASEAGKNKVQLTAGDAVCVKSNSNAWRNRRFYFSIPSSAAFAHGTGDGDLYYRQSNYPTIRNYYDRSANAGNNENIQVADGNTGTAYVRIYGAHAGMSIQVDFN